MMLPTVWEAVDQDETVEMISIDCEMGEWRQTLDVGSTWSLYDFRHEILIYFEANMEFQIEIVDG
jgi:hypothetical protein